MTAANVVPIKEEPTYKASEIVTAVGLAIDVGGGKMTLSTHVMNSEGVPALKTKLDQLTAAADWVSAKYALRNLKLQLDQENKQLVSFREERESLVKRYGTEWGMMKRRGDLQLTTSQQSTVSNFDNSIKSRIQVIEKLKKDIAITEAILDGKV